MAGTTEYLGVLNDNKSWGISDVFHFELDARGHRLSGKTNTSGEAQVGYGEPRTLGRNKVFAAQFIGYLPAGNGFPIGVKSLFYKNYADHRYTNAETGRYGRDEGPQRHFLLGEKILFGAPLAAIGILLGWWGLSYADWRNTRYWHIAYIALAIFGGLSIFTTGLLIMFL